MNTIPAFDFIRSFAIFFVFVAHVLNKQCHNSVIIVIERSISPGLTMSVLGFMSAYLLTSKYRDFDGSFYVRRFLRIYSSLIICLALISILHVFLSYDVINQHSIVHFMGLSFFFELLQVHNKSSLGSGLWFITIINIMYLFLPLLWVIYSHANKKIHLLLVIIICLFFNRVMYGTASSWNVIIAFNIGCFVGFNSNIEDFSKRSLADYSLMTIFLLILSGLAVAGIMPYETRLLLLPLYPLYALPMLYKIGSRITGVTRTAVKWFSSISYEFYILHFYFINENFSDIFPAIKSLALQFVISITIVLPLAYCSARISRYVSKLIVTYMLHTSTETKSQATGLGSTLGQAVR